MKTYIFRTKKGKEFPQERFTSISSRLLKIPSSYLSDGGFRVLIFLLSQRDDYVAYVEEVAVQLNKTEKTIKKHFDELIEKGYCVKEGITYKKNNYTWFEFPGLNPSYKGEIPSYDKWKEETKIRKSIREEKKRKRGLGKHYTNDNGVSSFIISENDSNDYPLNDDEVIELFGGDEGINSKQMPVISSDNDGKDYRLMTTNLNEYYFNKDYNKDYSKEEENISLDDELGKGQSCHQYQSEEYEEITPNDYVPTPNDNLVINDARPDPDGVYNPSRILQQSGEWERLKREYSGLVNFDSVFRKCLELVDEDAEKGVFSDEVILVRRFEALLKNKIILKAKDKNAIILSEQIPESRTSQSVSMKETNQKYISAWKNKEETHQQAIRRIHANVLKKINTTISVEEYSFVMDLLLEKYSGEIIDKGILKFVSIYGYNQLFVTGKRILAFMEEFCDE